MKTTLLITYIFKIVAVIIFLSGIVPTVGGLVWWRYVHNFVQSAEQAEGTVIEIVEDRAKEGGTVYRPVIEFTDQFGQRHEHRASVGTGISSLVPAVGDKIQILYDRDNPKSAEINHWLHLYFGPGICLTLGIVPFVLGICMFVAAWLVARKATRLA